MPPTSPVLGVPGIWSDLWPFLADLSYLSRVKEPKLPQWNRRCDLNLDTGSLLASLQAPGKGSLHGEGREQPLKLVPRMDFKGTLWAAEKEVPDPTGGQTRNLKMRVDPAVIMSVSALY